MLYAATALPDLSTFTHHQVKAHVLDRIGDPVSCHQSEHLLGGVTANGFSRCANAAEARHHKLGGGQIVESQDGNLLGDFNADARGFQQGAPGPSSRCPRPIRPGS